MIIHKDRFKFGLFGFMLSAILLGVPYVYSYGGLFEDEPYVVNNVHYKAEGDYLQITVGFTKIECQFDRIDVFGYYLGEWFLIPWTNTSSEDVTGDRISGEQTLRITIGPINRDYSIVEVRTRHLCGTDDPNVIYGDRYKVDQTMVSITLNIED